MNTQRPIVLSIAGFDPSAGAGLLADTKTFESHGVYGISACTALTYQNDREFIGLDWCTLSSIEQQLLVLQNSFSPQAVKIGLVENMKVLSTILDLVRAWVPDAFVLWDPIMRASAGFEFHGKIDDSAIQEVASKISLITPNYEELKQISGSEPLPFARKLSNAVGVLVTGVLGDAEIEDILYLDGHELSFEREYLANFEKHGSGCVFSSSLCAHVALGFSLEESADLAGEYVSRFLRSNDSLCGYHELASCTLSDSEQSDLLELDSSGGLP